jgi:predicted permease
MTVLHDLRFALRMLVKDRWFTVIAAFVLALGIGANNTVFTIVNGILLRPIPFDKPEQIMLVTSRDTRGRQQGVSVLDFDDWRKASHSFSHLVFLFPGSAVLSEEDRVPEQYPGVYVSPDFFKMMRVSPVLGRDFSALEDGPGGPAVVMIGSSVWKQRYGGDPSVIGRSVRINGATATIVGVMPEGMKFPFDDEVWMATSMLPPAYRNAPRDNRNFAAMGRLADGVTVEQARAELKTIGDQLARQYPDSNKDTGPWMRPFLETVAGPQLRLIFWALQGAVAFVLLIACANVANLLLARAASRSNEISVRVALGASRWQIIRQVLIESVVLALVAGAVGLLLSMGGIKWFDAQTQNVGKPYWMTFAMDWRTFAFFMGVCVFTGILFGLAPALHVSRTNIGEMLKEGGRTGSSGRRAHRWSTVLVTAEIALTLVLLAGAGFMMRSFMRMYNMEIGIDTSHMVVMNLIMPARRYPEVEDRVRFLHAVEQRLSGSGDIQWVTITSNAPGSGGPNRQLEVDGHRAAEGEQRPRVTTMTVGPRYFDTLGVKVRGRAFTETDGDPSRQTVIVNERLAQMYFPGQNPIDHQLRLLLDRPTAPNEGWLTVVGVVPNVRQRLNNSATPNANIESDEFDAIAYIPHRVDSSAARGMTLLARTRSDAGKASQSLREAIRTIDPDMALFNLRTLDDLLVQQRWAQRVFATMFSTFAVIALLLAAVGLYGVTAYSVAQHTREIGIRMVLGAPPRNVVGLFLRRGIIQLAVGLTVGLAGAIAVGRLLQSVLIAVSPRDPVTLGAIMTLLTLVGVAACVWPARRATRLDPVVALRHE